MVAREEDKLSAQVAVLGSLLIDDRLVGQALERIRPEDFLAPKCRMVFQAIRALFAEGKPTDAVTVRSKLGGREDDGWTQYLMELMELTPTASNIWEYPDIIWRTDYEGLDIIPAGEDLADYELSRLLLGEKPNFDRMRRLMEAIKEDNVYDSVVIDCPPYYSISCLSTIAVSDSIIIPAGIDAYSTTGMAGLVRQIDNIRQACPQIRVAGVLVTQWRRSSIGEDAVQTLREESPVPIFRTVIRRTDKVVESSWSREPVGALSPFSSASRDYRTWVAELLEREGVANNA